MKKAIQPPALSYYIIKIMNYIGSELSLLEFIEGSIKEVVGEKCTTCCDLFAGTGIAGNYSKKRGYKIIANDIQYYSYVLNKPYIGNYQDHPIPIIA